LLLLVVDISFKIKGDSLDQIIHNLNSTKNDRTLWQFLLLAIWKLIVKSWDARYGMLLNGGGIKDKVEL
jgi:hypothetical protein